MLYSFKGRLCGYICEECLEPLSHAKVRLYRIAEGRNVTTLAVAAPKDTFAILTDEQVSEKKNLLIAEGEVDEQGNFSFDLGENDRYNGEPFEVDVYCGTVPPHLPPSRHEPPPVQFTLTTLQPLWRETQSGLVFGWEYCLPARLWCLIRARFGVWVICGSVTRCDDGRDTHVPVPNVRVRAFDVDWLQDDAIGSDVTNASGHFHIYYTPQNFRVTPFSPLFNIEWVGGPDVYFQIETLLGTPLLVESRSAGRTPQRENRGPCTCVHLCIDKDKVPPPTTTEALSVFDSIGIYNYLTDIDSGAAGDGLTLGQNRAFYSTLRLNGILAQTKNGNPLEYAFEVAAYDPTTNVLGAYTQISLAQVAETIIGKWEHLTTGPVETKNYVLNGVAGPNVLVPQVSADGWVRVPQENNVSSPQGKFIPSAGSLPGFINLKSETLRTFGVIDESAVQAGETAGPPNAQLGRVFYFSLRMKVREAIGGVPVAGSEQFAGTCVRLAIMNTSYNNVSKNGSWVPHTVSGQMGVASLDITELAGAGCAEITTSLTVKYTAAHPNLGGFTLSMEGPGGPYSFLPAVAGGTADNSFGEATNDFVLANLEDCAYIVKLTAPLLLTTGDSNAGNLFDEVAFCKDTTKPNP
jgi:hypothetical protein